MNRLFSGLLLICLAPSLVWANDSTINIDVSPFGLAAEYKVADKVTIGIGYAEFSPVIAFGSYNDYASTGSVSARVNWYAQGALQRGTYAALFLEYASFDYDSAQWWVADAAQLKGSGKAPIAGFISGYHWAWGNNLTLSVGGGYGYMKRVDIDVIDSVTAVQSVQRVGGFGGPVFDVTFGTSF